MRQRTSLCPSDHRSSDRYQVGLAGDVACYFFNDGEEGRDFHPKNSRMVRRTFGVMNLLVFGSPRPQ